jgi:hypothetical protein
VVSNGTNENTGTHQGTGANQGTALGQNAETANRALAFIFGASNVRRGLPSLLQTTCNTLGTNWDLIVTAGHGRSYGAASYVFGRGLPGITSAHWHRHLDQSLQHKWALFTDVGNDLLYGKTPLQISDWLEQCVAVLCRDRAMITIVGLPFEVLKRVGRKKFLLLRTIFFPKSELDFLTALERIELLEESVREIAQRYQTKYVEPSSTWYGMDPIHVMYGYYDVLWQRSLPWLNDEKSPFFIGENEQRSFNANRALQRWRWMMKMFFVRAHEQTWFTFQRSMKQPALRIDAQRNVWFY